MEPARLLAIEEIIADIASSDKPLSSSRLTELSNLNSEELESFGRSWSAIEPERRCQALQQLIELTEHNLELNFDGIFKYCLQDHDDEVRSKAIEGLWENEEAALINPLINMLEQDSSEKVQVAAAMALGKFVMLAEHRKLRSHHVTRLQQALLATVNNPNKTMEVRRRALESVAPLSHPQVKTAIAEAYQSQHRRLKVSSIYAVGKSCDPAWLPVLLKEMDSADDEVRYEAAGACAELEEEAAVPGLAKLVDDTDINVQMAAIQALGKIGGPQAKKCLEQCLDNPDQAINQTARQAMLELEAKEDFLSFPNLKGLS